MQVTDEMVAAALRVLFGPGATPDAALRAKVCDAVQAALDAMPKATGGLIQQLADVTPPEKVRRAAAATPGITFNLEQQYGGVDEAVAHKLGIEPDAPRAADG